MKGGVFQVILQSLQVQSQVMAQGAVNITSRVFCIARWQPDSNPSNFRITTMQVWIKLHDLVKMVDVESNIDINFFAPVSYESFPKFYIHCVSFTHATSSCNSVGHDFQHAFKVMESRNKEPLQQTCKTQMREAKRRR